MSDEFLKVSKDKVLKAMEQCPDQAKQVLETLFGDQLTPVGLVGLKVGDWFLVEFTVGHKPKKIVSVIVPTHDGPVFVAPMDQTQWGYCVDVFETGRTRWDLIRFKDDFLSEYKKKITKLTKKEALVAMAEEIGGKAILVGD